jgi:hypothetical protein
MIDPIKAKGTIYDLSQPPKMVTKITFLVCGEFAFAHEYVLALRLA